MILIIDNYDSFVFNIARYCVELEQTVLVRRNDELTLDAIQDLNPEAIILSPGPCGPFEAGISLSLIERFSGQIPLLGICLGHQCIGAGFGGTIRRASEPMHGRASLIDHDGTGVFRGLPSPFSVGRYHSLIVDFSDEEPLPLRITARSSSGEIMGLTHRTHPTFGVQFHPESILTDYGYPLIQNFLTLSSEFGTNALV
jgi:para-aminobenzoate synthetase component II